MATNAIVVLALLLQGVYSRPQNSDTSETTSSGVTINVEGSGPTGVSDLIRNAAAIPIDMAGVGVSGAQVGVDTARQIISALFAPGSGSVQMTMTPAWTSMMNMIQQGGGTESASQMMSGIMSLMSQPTMMTMFRQMVDNGVLTQGEGTTVNINVTKLPTEYANQLISMFGTSSNDTVTIDLAQPRSWAPITSLMQQGLSLVNNGIALGVDAAKMPMEFASQGINMMRQLIPGQSGNALSIGTLPSWASLGNMVGQLGTNSAQLKLDAMQLPIDAASNGIAAAQELVTGTGTQGGSGSVTITSGGTDVNGQGGSLTVTRNGGLSTATSGLDGLINAGARLANSGIGLGLDTAGLGVNMAGAGIDTTRSLMSGLLTGRPYFGSLYGGMRTPSFSFSTTG